MTTGEAPLFQKIIAKGNSYFSFEKSNLEERGQHLAKSLFARKFFDVGQYIESDFAICIPIGLHRKRICTLCLKHPLTRVKQRDDCTYLTYCSDQCFAAHATFLDSYGDIIEDLVSKNSVFIDTVILALRIVYFYEEKGLMSEYEHILQLYTPCNKVDSEIDELMTTMKGNNIKDLLLLCRIVKYNSQKFQVSKLASTDILCIMKQFSRINHSCNPNVVLTCEKDTKTFTVNMYAIRPIRPGDEVVMSYLSDLSLDPTLRQTYLRKLFYFDCACQRCFVEKSVVYDDSTEVTMERLDRIIAVVEESSSAEVSISQLYEYYCVAARGLSIHKVNCYLIMAYIMQRLDIRFSVSRFQLLLVGAAECLKAPQSYGENVEQKQKLMFFARQVIVGIEPLVINGCKDSYLLELYEKAQKYLALQL